MINNFKHLIRFEINLCSLIWTPSHRQRLLKVTAIRIDNTIYRFMLAKHENLITASNLFRSADFLQQGYVQTSVHTYSGHTMTWANYF